MMFTEEDKASVKILYLIMDYELRKQIMNEFPGKG